MEPLYYFKNPKNFEFAFLSKRLLIRKQPIKGSEYATAPFDFHCQSMKEKLWKGICSICDSCRPTAAAMLRHKKCHSADVLHEDEGCDELESDLSDSDSDQDVNRPEGVDKALPVFLTILATF